MVTSSGNVQAQIIQEFEFYQPRTLPDRRRLFYDLNNNGWISIRDECLNEHWFLSVADAQVRVEAWRGHYTGERPHSLWTKKTRALILKLSSTSKSRDLILPRALGRLPEPGPLFNAQCAGQRISLAIFASTLGVLAWDSV